MADPKVTVVVVNTGSFWAHEHRVGGVALAVPAGDRRRLDARRGRRRHLIWLRDMVEVLTSFCARLYGRKVRAQPGTEGRGLRAARCRTSGGCQW